jgi:hypothetical protein
MELSRTRELIDLTQRFQEHLFFEFDNLNGELTEKLALFHIGREHMKFLCHLLNREENLIVSPLEYWFLKYKDFVPKIQTKCKVILQNPEILISFYINNYYRLFTEFIVEEFNNMLDLAKRTFEDFVKTNNFK